MKTEVLVNDDVTVSDQSREIRMFHLHLVSLVSVKCLSLLSYDLIRVGLLGRLKRVSCEVTEHLGGSELDHYVKVLEETIFRPNLDFRGRVGGFYDVQGQSE